MVGLAGFALLWAILNLEDIPFLLLILVSVLPLDRTFYAMGVGRYNNFSYALVLLTAWAILRHKFTIRQLFGWKGSLPLFVFVYVSTIGIARTMGSFHTAMTLALVPFAAWLFIGLVTGVPDQDRPRFLTYVTGYFIGTVLMGVFLLATQDVVLVERIDLRLLRLGTGLGLMPEINSRTLGMGALAGLVVLSLRQNKPRLLITLGVAVCIYDMVRTGSRGGFSVLAFGLLVAGLFTTTRFRQMRVLLLAVFLVALAFRLTEVFAPEFYETYVVRAGYYRFGVLLSGDEAEIRRFTTLRSETYKVAWQQFLSSPIIGVGTGNGYALSIEYALAAMIDLSRRTDITLHSFYLRVVAELGLLGATPLVLFLACVWQRCWLNRRQIGFAAALLGGALLWPLTTNALELDHWVMMGLLLVLSRSSVELEDVKAVTQTQTGSSLALSATRARGGS